MARQRRKHLSVQCPACYSTAVGYHSSKLTHPHDICLEQPKRLEVKKHRFRCYNKECPVKTFLVPSDEVAQRARYTQRSKAYAVEKITKYDTPYCRCPEELSTQVHIRPAISTIYSWVKHKAQRLEPIEQTPEIVCTDEKHPRKKTRLTEEFTIVTVAPKESSSSKRDALLHLNASPSNDAYALETHFKQLIQKGLQADQVRLVISDLHPGYTTAIRKCFPKALHQLCVAHIIQDANRHLRKSQTAYRRQHIPQGQRQQVYQDCFTLLKNQEELSRDEHATIEKLFQQHPDLERPYCLKEDIRSIFLYSATLCEAYARRDIILDQYTEVPSQMKPVLVLLNDHFDSMVSYLKLGYQTKTNNSVERYMKKFKKIDKVHYHFRTTDSKIRHYEAKFAFG
jgi:transposase